MSASNLRRRLHHANVDGRKNEHVDISHVDSLDEPLLGKSSYDGGGSEVYDPRRQDLWDDDDRKKEQLHWSFLFSNLIAQWAQWLANIIVSSGSIFGRLFPFSSDNETSNPVYLSPLQEERLDNLRRRLKIPFDGSRIEHQVRTMESSDMPLYYYYCFSTGHALMEAKQLIGIILFRTP
ncbi:uncharacterized protein LOC119285564 isoform X1 [Triticum dicoccoides]|uniref:uncharacterized protein LOC119285564 isoform X1 n=1 Tax=Triticum dicoccoides TaxID=85692 RepID=UPI00188E1F8A|nr:uncharacterized protein LOC119285564 isoform X1 [Triticum dicoccoides]